MPDYHVGCGAFGIYAGTLEPRNKNKWRNKSNVTEEAIGSVVQYIKQELDYQDRHKFYTEYTFNDGQRVSLTIEKIEGYDPDDEG